MSWPNNQIYLLCPTLVKDWSLLSTAIQRGFLLISQHVEACATFSRSYSYQSSRIIHNMHLKPLYSCLCASCLAFILYGVWCNYMATSFTLCVWCATAMYLVARMLLVRNLYLCAFECLSTDAPKSQCCSQILILCLLLMRSYVIYFLQRDYSALWIPRWREYVLQ